MAVVYNSAARPIDLGAILESQNPVIDLHIKDYEVSTRRFLKAVSAYTSRAVDEITNRRNRHAQELKRTADKKQQIDVETTACKHKEIKLMEVLERELAERKDAESSVSELKRQFALTKEKYTVIDEEIQQCQDEVNSLLREQQKDMAVLETHASLAFPELQDCEAWLKCRIEGVGQDSLIISFKEIDPSSSSREFSVVVDVSSHTYQVPMTTPPIPTLPLLVDNLNKTRDIYHFVRDIRKAFESVYKDL